MLLRPQTTPVGPTVNMNHGGSTRIITGGTAAMTRTPGMLPPLPDFTPNLDVLYLASKHRISSTLSKAHRRKSESARVTRHRRKRSDSDGSTSLADGSETDRCKTAESDFLMDGAIDDIDLSDDEPFCGSTETDLKSSMDKFQKSYLHMCKVLRANPSSLFVKGLKKPRISLTNYELGPKGAKPCCVALALNPPVEALELRGNGIGPLGAAYMAEMLSQNIFLTELCLADNRLGSEGALVLSKIIVNNETLRKLDLSGNGFEEKDAIYFADILRENLTLKELNLSHNCFRERGGEVIGPSLVDNTNLELLDLSWNHLRRRGGVAICDGIKNNIGLKTVNLAWNGLYMEGCKALSKALVVNRTMTELNVSCNRIDRKCLDELLKGLVKNESVRVFRVGDNPLTTDGAVAILRMLEKKTAVPLEVLDLSGQCVDCKFIKLLEKLQESRTLKVSHGNLLRKDDDSGKQDNQGYIEGDPMMVLMEFMRLQNLRLVDLFVCLDTDGSKTLTRKEFREGLMKANIPVSPEGLDRLINKLDADGDGEVDYAELIQGQKDHKRKLAKMMKRSKEDNVIFEDTEIGLISLQLKALIAFRNAAKKEALSKKRTGLAAIVGQALDQNRKPGTSRPPSGTSTSLLPPSVASSSRPTSPSTSGTTQGSSLRLAHDLRPASTPLSKLGGVTGSGGGGSKLSVADRVRRALTPGPGEGMASASLGPDMNGWRASPLSCASSPEFGTPSDRRSPTL